MNNFRKTLKRFVPFAFMILVLFLLFHYWDNLVGLGILCLDAAASLIIGFVIAYIVNILMSSYEGWYEKIFKKTGKLSRVICMILAYVTIIVVLAIVIIVVGPQFVKSLIDVMTSAIDSFTAMLKDLSKDETLGKYAQQALEMLPKGSDMAGLIEKLGGFLLNGASGTFSSLIGSISSIVSGFTSVLIGIVFSIYILLDKEHLKKQFSEVVRVYFYKGDKILRVIGVLNTNFHNYIVAQVMDAIILGTLCGVGMWILRFPYPALSGVIVSITALIPVVGSFLGATIAAFVIFTVSPIKVLFFIIYIVLLQQVDNNFIYPKVVGSNVNLQSIWVLAAITIGGGLFGVVGMLCGVPIAATVYQLLKEDYNKRLEEEKNEETVIVDDYVAEEADSKSDVCN